MAALTTPIVRGDMRLYPGMPVKRINVRAVRGGKQRVGPPGSVVVGGSAAALGGRRQRSDSELSAHSAFDVSSTPAHTGPAQPRPSPLSISQQYLSQRRSHGHKPMTEEQRRKRATSCMNPIPEEACAPAAAQEAFKRKGGGSIRRFFQKLRLRKPDEPEPPRGLAADAEAGEKTWRNPSNEHLQHTDSDES